MWVCVSVFPHIHPSSNLLIARYLASTAPALFWACNRVEERDFELLITAELLPRIPPAARWRWQSVVVTVSVAVGMNETTRKASEWGRRQEGGVLEWDTFLVVTIQNEALAIHCLATGRRLHSSKAEKEQRRGRAAPEKSPRDFLARCLQTIV